MVEFGSNAWLIAYDISDPRRLNRVWRLLKSVAMPVQYSVFLAWLSDAEVRRLSDDLATRINAREDDVRLYHLPTRTDLSTLGRQWLPDNVHLIDRGWAIANRPSALPKAVVVAGC